MTRKDLILNHIKDYTMNAISDSSFNFDVCNANDIALDLKLDRSNVSRIMNQLFNEFLLIKVQGRPTLYLSKEVVAQNFKNVNIPHIIMSVDGIRDFFNNSNITDEPVSRKDFDIIGNDYNESLHSIINRVSPVVYFPQNYPIVIAIQGEKGVGKKFFCTQLFNLGIKFKKFTKKNRMYFTSYTDINENTAHIKGDLIANTVSMIVVEIFTNFNENIVYWFKNSINTLYENEGKPYPIIVFLVDSSVENFQYFSYLTPYAVQYPNVRQRTAKEMVQLVLTFLQNESKNHNCHIKVSSSTIQSIICSHYPFNLFQMKNEINYLVTNKIYATTLGHNDSILLTHDVPKSISSMSDYPPLFEDRIAQAITQFIPGIIDFYPDKPCETLDNLHNTQFPSTIFQKVEVKTIALRALHDVLTSPTNLVADVITKNTRLIMLITPLFASSKLKNEKQIIGNLCNRIDAMITNTFNYDFLLEDLVFKETPQSTEIANNIINIVEIRFTVVLNKVNRSYIRNYVYHALMSNKSDSISTLILCHGEAVAENYAQHFNLVSASRTYYSFDFTQNYQDCDFQKVINKLSEFIKQIDHGKGVIIISDREPLSLIEKPLVASTNILVFSLFPVSLPLLYNASELVNLKTIHLGSLLYEIINKKKGITKFLLSDTYIQKSVRTGSSIFASISKTFPNINITKAGESLFSALSIICQKAKLDMTNDLIIQFMFHGFFMIDRSFTKIQRENSSMEIFKIQNEELFQIVKDSILSIRDFISLQIEDSEFAVLAEMLKNYQQNLSNKIVKISPDSQAK